MLVHAKRVRQFFINTAIGGLLILLPLAIFIWLLRFMISFITGILKPIADVIGAYTQYSTTILDIISLAIALIVCFLVGLFVRTRTGLRTFSGFETRYLQRLPLYGMIKETVQQLGGKQKTIFKDVVIITVSGVSMTGFITEEHGDGRLTVIVPTAPNPTNGFIFHVQESQIQRVGVSTEDAMRTILSLGVGSENLFQHIQTTGRTERPTAGSDSLS